MNVTFAPAQIVRPGLAEMETEGVRFGFTIIARLLLVALTGETQLALLVRIQETIFPFINDDVVNEDELVPALIPSTNH